MTSTQTATNPDNYFGLHAEHQHRQADQRHRQRHRHRASVPVGSTVTWTYNVTNTGQRRCSERDGHDDKHAGDATTAVPDLPAGFNVGDTNPDGLLDPARPGSLSASGTAVAGQYTNIGTATGTPATTTARPSPISTAGYQPRQLLRLRRDDQIIKLTNGTDNDSPTGPAGAGRHERSPGPTTSPTPATSPSATSPSPTTSRG